MIEKDRIICGDAKQAWRLPDGVVDLTVTSPPYFRHRDYGVNGQLGREASVERVQTNIRGVLTELLRVTAETARVFSWLVTLMKARNCFWCRIASP